MLSAGMFSALAATIAVRRRGFVSGSPPLFAAIAISLMRRVKILPRLASSAPFLCLIVAHLEWPDMGIPPSKELKLRRFAQLQVRPRRKSQDQPRRKQFRRLQIIAWHEAASAELLRVRGRGAMLVDYE